MNIMDYGAVADGKSLCTGAIQSAIDECSRDGGRLVFPAVTYLTGTFYIKAGVAASHQQAPASVTAATHHGSRGVEDGCRPEPV